MTNWLCIAIFRDGDNLQVFEATSDYDELATNLCDRDGNLDARLAYVIIQEGIYPDVRFETRSPDAVQQDALVIWRDWEATERHDKGIAQVGVRS